MTTALITGGSSGIGAAFARALAVKGHDLVLVARNSDRLAKAAAQLTADHQVVVETISADLGERADVLRVVERVASAEQPIDLLINNAGFGVRARLLSEDIDELDHALDVMVRAVMILSGSAGRAMGARGSGSIINVSSTAGFVTMGAYSAIKAWVTVYSEGLSNELRDSGVTVTALCPGWVRTEFHERAEISTGSIPKVLWLEADDLVAEALADAEAGKVISIPSKRYAVLMGVASRLPRVVVRTISRRLSARRH